MNPFTDRAIARTLLATTLPILLTAQHHAAQLVNWDVPGGTATSALTSSVATGLSASPITLSGLNLNSSGSLWRTRGYNDSTTRYLTFSITASPGNTVTIESLIFTANAQAGTGAAWTAPTVRLDHSTDASFASGVIESGSLSLGPDLASASTGTPVTANSGTYFATDLVINGGETYYFRLVGIGANSSTQNQISYNSNNDMQINGSVVTSSSNLVWSGADGANWNTTEQNFTNGGNPANFATNDNVTIQTSGLINVDAGGINAGIITHSATTGTTTLDGGTLTSSGLVKTGTGTLAIEALMAFSTGPGTTTLSGGTLQVLDGGSFTTASIDLSGGATIQSAAGATFTSAGPNSLGSGGGTISNNSDITLANISNTTPGTPFVKSGSGVLTLSGIGTQITGPVDLDITAGSVIANGPLGTGRQINIIGSNVFDGNLTLNGPVLMLHGSTVSGSGSIIINNATSSITSRLNAGAVDVGIPVTLTTNVNVESPNGGNILRFNGPITGEFGLVKKGNGIVELAATNSHTTTSIEAGTLRVGTGTSGTLGTGDVSVASTGILSFNRDDTTTVANTITGLGRVTMAGGNNALVELTGANTYTGITNITSGTLGAPVMSNGDLPGSIGAASADAANIVLNGGTLAHTGPTTTCDRGFTLGIAGGTIAANGTGALSLDNTSNIALAEPTAVTVGNLTIGTNYQIVDPGDTNFVEIGALNNNAGTTFTATGPGTGTGTVVFANIRPLRLAGTAPGIHELAAVISDASNAPTSLTKNGTNVWSITGPNTYTGNTRVNEGTLLIHGDNSAATGAVTIAGSGLLGGNGSSGGQVTLESGGGLSVRITDWTGAPGTGYHDLAVASLDAAAVPMTVTIDSSGLANFTDSGKSFTILNTSGGITNFNSANVTITAPGFAGTGNWSLTQSGNSLVLTYALGGNYSTWATSNGIGGEPPFGDFDKDGITNFVEYALGLIPTASSGTPGTFIGGTLSFTKGTEAKANGDVTYEIEESTTLGSWTVVVPNAPAEPTISHTLPAGQPKQFARLKITQIP